jgi:hypothetical protein
MEEAKKRTWDAPGVKEARDHFKSARAAFWKSTEALLPPGFVENRRKARKEILLGLRSLLNAAIDYTEQQEKSS